MQFSFKATYTFVHLLSCMAYSGVTITPLPSCPSFLCPYRCLVWSRGPGPFCPQSHACLVLWATRGCARGAVRAAGGGAPGAGQAAGGTAGE